MPSRFRQDAKTGAAVPVPSEASGPDVPVVPGASVVSAAADTDGDGAGPAGRRCGNRAGGGGAVRFPLSAGRERGQASHDEQEPFRLVRIWFRHRAPTLSWRRCPYHTKSYAEASGKGFNLSRTRRYGVLPGTPGLWDGFAVQEAFQGDLFAPQTQYDVRLAGAFKASVFIK